MYTELVVFSGFFTNRIRDYIKTGEIKSAINYCRITNTPSSRMIEKGIMRMGRRALEEGQYIGAGQSITYILPDTQKWVIRRRLVFSSVQRNL